jgi:hypothetical protein
LLRVLEALEAEDELEAAEEVRPTLADRATTRGC